MRKCATKVGSYYNVLTFIIKFASFPRFDTPNIMIPTCHFKFCPTFTSIWTRICRCKSICSRILRSNSINTLFYCVSIWYPFFWWSWFSFPFSLPTLGYKRRLFMVFAATLLKKWKYDLSEPIYFIHFNTHTLDNFQDLNFRFQIKYYQIKYS